MIRRSILPTTMVNDHPKIEQQRSQEKKTKKKKCYQIIHDNFYLINSATSHMNIQQFN